MIANAQHPEGIFLRPVSGLVRVAAFWDVFIYNLGLISVGIGAIYTQRYAPGYYPHASISLATVLAAVALSFVVAGFIAWTVAIPRSGGIYIFLSRAGYPAVGFAASFVETLSWLFYCAIAAKLVASAVVVPSLYFLAGNGVVTKAAGSNWGQFTIGLALIGFAAFVLIRGTRIFLAVQKLTFILAIVGTAALLVTLSTSNVRETLSGNLFPLIQSPSITDYPSLIDSATASGWKVPGSVNFDASVALIVWPVLPLIGAVFSIAIGGEIRNSSKNQTLGMFLSLLTSTGLFIAIASLSSKAIGNDVQGALAYLVDNGKLSIGEGASLDPNILLLSALGTNSIVARAAAFLGFLAWIWFWIPGLMSYGQRVFLAWALDRIAPEKLGELHGRYGTPYMSTILAAVLAAIFLALTIWSQFFSTLVFIIAGTLAWALTLALGSFFPYVRRSLFQKTQLGPLGKRGQLLMAGSCTLGTAAMVWIIVLLCRDPLAIGDPIKGFATVSVSFVFGFLLFRVSAWTRKRRGIDLSRAFEEIPVE